MREVYTSLVEAPWFNRNAVTERELLKLIFRVHSDGYTDRQAFGTLCREEAERRFSKAG